MENKHVVVILIVAVVVIATYFFITWGVKEYKQAVIAQKTGDIAGKVIDKVVDIPAQGLKKIFD